MLAKSLEKMGVSYRLWRWVSVILYLFSSMLAMVLLLLFYQTNLSEAVAAP